MSRPRPFPHESDYESPREKMLALENANLRGQIAKLEADLDYQRSNNDGLVAQLKTATENWLTEQRARLDESTLLEMYGAVKAKVEIGRLTDERDAAEAGFRKIHKKYEQTKQERDAAVATLESIASKGQCSECQRIANDFFSARWKDGAK